MKEGPPQMPQKTAAEKAKQEEQIKSAEQVNMERNDPNAPRGRRYDGYILGNKLKNLKTELGQKNLTSASDPERTATIQESIETVKSRIDLNDKLLKQKLDAMDPADQEKLAELEQKLKKLRSDQRLLDGGPENYSLSPNREEEWQKAVEELKKKIDEVERPIFALEDKYNL